MVTITTKATKKAATCKKERNCFRVFRNPLWIFPLPLLQPTALLVTAVFYGSRQLRLSNKILQISQITPHFPHLGALRHQGSQTGNADLQPYICDQSKEPCGE